jgi:DNA mismatch endonuclease, patch repair protein
MDGFWHGHNCPMFRLPGTRPEFCSAKIRANQERDGRALAALRESGWRVLTVWECSLKGPARLSLQKVLWDCAVFVRSTSLTKTMTGSWPCEFKKERAAVSVNFVSQAFPS